MRNWFRYCLIAAYPAVDPTLNFCSALASASNAQLIVLAVAAENVFIAFAVWLAINDIASSSIRTYCTAIRSSLLDWSGIPANLAVEWRRLPRLMKSLKWIFQESVRPRLPILQQHLLAVRAKLDLSSTDDLAFYTACLLGWNGLLRYLCLLG